MNKVKIFKSKYTDDLEKQVNLFLSKGNINVLNIVHSSSKFWFSIVIHYRV